MPTKLSVDSIEVVWKVHRDSPNFRAVEAVVGLLLDELIALASNPFMMKKLLHLHATAWALLVCIQHLNPSDMENHRIFRFLHYKSQ